MTTYKLTFDNGSKYSLTVKNLDDAHKRIVSYMSKHEDTKVCIIDCNGTTRRVIKSGTYHWNHNGFSFD